MSRRKLDLTSQVHFPTFAHLPEDSDCDIDLNYYDDGGSGVFEPLRHWCLLAEIVEPIPYFRPMFTAKDKGGNQFLVAMYLDNQVTLPEFWKKLCKPGNAVAIMYANSHRFMDGQRGVRVEEVGLVKMLPCSLDTLLSIGDELNGPLTNCLSCEKPASLKCSRCSMLYCDKNCQIRDWNEHKKKCAAIKQVTEWRSCNWRKFNDYWS